MLSRKQAFAALVLIALTSLCLGIAHGADATVTWTHPDKRTDDTPLPLSEIANFRVFYGPCLAGDEISPDSEFVQVPSSDTSVPITLTRGARWCFYVRTLDVFGLESEPSNTVSLDLSRLPPKPPSDPSVKFATITTTVFTVVKQTDRFVMVGVGTVPLGTPCIVDQSVNGYHVVPRSAVTWSGSVRPLVVVGSCG